MQLTPPARPSSIRARLRAAACLLLASAVPATARGDEAPGTQVEVSALLYGEQSRANVVEPLARITKVLPDGQSFSAQFGLDVITGASPTGATPSGRVQTVTTPSGNTKTTSATELPTTAFRDIRGSLDLDWTRPLGALVSPTFGVHVSREKDYQSLGANGRLSVELLNRRTTLTVGGGLNRDRVFPEGGVAEGLTDGTMLPGVTTRTKRVNTLLAGVSEVMSRRWLLGLSASHTDERGYLTEPYKVVSVLDAGGDPVSSLREKRPGARQRTSVLGSSVYHFTSDVLYSSYRWYRDDWGVRSHTLDLKYRHDLSEQTFLQPHARLYTQSQADFFTFGLLRSAALPAFASSDQRLGPLRSATLGTTYGFAVPGYPGQFSVRAEYLVQWGKGHPADAVGLQKRLDLFPTESIGSLLVSWSHGW